MSPKLENIDIFNAENNEDEDLNSSTETTYIDINNISLS